jgi:hypothetical protein
VLELAASWRRCAGGKRRGGGTSDVVVEVRLSNADRTATVAKAEGSQPAGTNGIADRALADPQHVRSLADGQEAWLSLLGISEICGLFCRRGGRRGTKVTGDEGLHDW